MLDLLTKYLPKEQAQEIIDGLEHSELALLYALDGKEFDIEKEIVEYIDESEQDIDDILSEFEQDHNATDEQLQAYGKALWAEKDLRHTIASILSDNVYYSSQKYEVMEEEDAEALAREYVEDIARDCYFHEMPEHLHTYFDMDKYVDEVLRYDDLETVLASYDGIIHYVEVEGIDYVVYRQ